MPGAETSNVTRTAEGGFTGHEDRGGIARDPRRRFGLVMMSMGASLGLYYLGFFGNVDGPLAPERLAGTLTRAGIGRWHLLAILGLATILAAGWNRASGPFARRPVPGGLQPLTPRRGSVARTVWICCAVAFAVALYACVRY